MRFWLSRDTAIPVREQLAAQLVLGILSRHFAPGDRLPSVRALARSLKIHANTVSAAYQDLAARGWVTRRAGAGVFVANRLDSQRHNSLASFAIECVRDGLTRGYSPAELHAAFVSALQKDDREQPVEVIIVDPDLELARIVAAEILEATGRTFPSFDLLGATKGIQPGTLVLANEAYIAEIEKLVTGPVRIQAIRLRSMHEVVAGQLRPTRPVLICIASKSGSILRWSATLLSALGFPPDTVIHRNVSKPGWAEGLRACDIVGVDVLTAAMVPADLPVVIFRIVSEEFLNAMKSV